ncbi:hypothetical protein FGIG_01715 [Fasciola gigantica]|uniref:Uncharacterized protein n=1 Tax=Fasciola gigantica TaxID=46835 RepID=A0A504YV14_FASGI|nr:hypothetical protein FGIG_01715 [Fasciola gigantica]
MAIVLCISFLAILGNWKSLTIPVITFWHCLICRSWNSYSMKKTSHRERKFVECSLLRSFVLNEQSPNWISSKYFVCQPKDQLLVIWR